MFFVAVLFVAYEARLTIFNNMSFGKTIEKKFIFFYKLSSFTDTSILKTDAVHQPLIILQSQHFKLRLSDKFLLISLSVLVKLTISLLFLLLFAFCFSWLATILAKRLKIFWTRESNQCSRAIKFMLPSMKLLFFVAL